MAEVAASPSGLVRVPSSQARGRRCRASSPARTSSPCRRRGASPLRAHSRKDSAVLSPRAHLPVLSSSQGTSSPFWTESSAPSLRRSQGFVPRHPQPLVGKVLSRPVCQSLKFPGPTEEEKDTERPVALLEARNEGDNIPEQEEDEASTVPPQAKSGLDRIELKAKESLAKLKHLLYKLKTRDGGEVKSTIVTSPSFSEQPTVVEEEQQVFVSQKIEVDLSALPAESTSALEAATAGTSAEVSEETTAGVSFDLASLEDGLEIQLDAVTATRAVVTFDDVTKTAVVTVTATVRAAELEDQGRYSEKAIAMAARALARTCLDLDEKAQATAVATTSVSLGQLKLKTASPTTAASNGSQQKMERALLSGSIVSWSMASQEFGCTPFRPVYLVTLQLFNNSTVEAIFKPCLPGDRLLRWKRAPEDWVAYQMASLLGLDCVSPAVLRSGVKLGNREFDLSVLVLKPAVVARLENTDPSLVATNPQTIVSDIRILDTLIGSVVRQREGFLAMQGGMFGESVGGEALFTPLALGHPMGPRLGCGIHSMWSTIGQKAASSPAVKVVSQSTYNQLKGLSRGLLMDLFGGVLSVEEIETILGRRDHLLAYFGGLARKQGWGNVCI